ncbi:MAG: hypothetical protein ABFE08_06010 [Armatimonadia bacterium]
MGTNEWMVIVPAAAEGLLLTACLLVWMKLRTLRVSGVCELTLGAITVDAAVQSWQLWLRAGGPAGVAWLLHAMLSYVMVYVLYRLGELLWRLREQKEGACAAKRWVGPATPEQIEVG